MLIVLAAASIIGLTLGMLGSGGSAMTVPLLIYVVGHGTKESIAESMAIVGLISVSAAIPYAQANQVDWRSVWWFGLPGMAGTFIGAWLGSLANEALQLVVFAIVLIAAAYSMLRKPKQRSVPSDETRHTRPPLWHLGFQGCCVGMLTGFVGVGGGFLIVPALVILGRLPMRLAIGTSLVIIVFNASIGFLKYEHHLVTNNTSVDMTTILIFAVVGTIGSFVGRSINQRLNQRRLQQVFAYFLILLGSFVIFREGNRLLVASTEHRSASVSIHVRIPNNTNSIRGR